MLKLVFIGALLIVSAHARTTGADAQACAGNGLTPQHGSNSPQSGPSPYGITVTSNQYSAGSKLVVTLKGQQNFMGFLIVAVKSGERSSAAVGSFEAANATDTTLVHELCSGGLTHSSGFTTALRDEIILEWTAPSPIVGHVIFLATFVEKFDTFWVAVESSTISDGSTTAAPAGPATDPPQIGPITAEGCGTDKSCYDDCKSGKCGFLLTWKKTSDTKVSFELFASLDKSQGYVALGISDDDKMTDVSIIACTADASGKSQVEQFYASTRSNPTKLTRGPASSDPTEASIETSSRAMSCRFSYDNNVAKSEPSKWKDLNGEFFAFVARGAYVPGVLIKHTSRPEISPSAQHFLSDTYIQVGGTRIAALVKAHACIMILAWVFCASVGLILARYFKPMWTDSKACGQKVWFSYHRILMLSAMFLTIIGFILILVEKGGAFVPPKELPTRAHPILGLIAIICALLNPLIAAVRCHPGDSKRPIFNWIHWFFGTVAHVFAICAIITGCLFLTPTWLWYVPLGFAVYDVYNTLILEKYTRGLESSAPTDAPNLPLPMSVESAINKAGPQQDGESMKGEEEDRQEEYQLSNKSGNEPPYAGRGFKCAMLVIYMIVVTIITITLIVIIAGWGSFPGTTS